MMEKVEEREAITLINEDQKIFGIFHQPLSKEKTPAVLICPGFGGNKCGKHRLFVSLGKELAKKGIAVLRFDYRGAGDSEGEFDDITLDSKVSDTLKCLDFLQKHPSIDATRIGLLGRSLGGAIAVLAARKNQHIKSMALWAPVFTSEPWKKMWEAYKINPQQFAKKDILASLPNMPNLRFLEQFFKLDITSELDALKNIPLLHIHGDKDAIVKVEHSEAYKKARVESDKTKFVQLHHSDHDFSDSTDQKIAISETCDWYHQTL
jgi:uncharacterized protein